MNHQNELKIKALGRVATLGTLYDGRRENFCSFSLFNTDIPKNCSKIVDIASTKYDYDYLNTFQSKFHKLDVEAQLKVSVLCGLVKLEGSGKYLTDKKESFKSVKGSLIYEITTKFEFFELSNESIREIISYKSLENNEATHVVTGIKWGANAIASFEYSNEESSDKTLIEGNLEAIINALKFTISGGARADFNEGQNRLKSSLSIKFFSDMVAQDRELPQTYEQALDLMRMMPRYISSYNDGKGSPLEYTLCPLNIVEKFFNREIIVARFLKELDLAKIKRAEITFDKVLEAIQKLNDFNSQVSKNKDFGNQKTKN